MKGAIDEKADICRVTKKFCVYGIGGWMKDEFAGFNAQYYLQDSLPLGN